MLLSIRLSWFSWICYYHYRFDFVLFWLTSHLGCIPALCFLCWMSNLKIDGCYNFPFTGLTLYSWGIDTVSLENACRHGSPAFWQGWCLSLTSLRFHLHLECSRCRIPLNLMCGFKYGHRMKISSWHCTDMSIWRYYIFSCKVILLTPLCSIVMLNSNGTHWEIMWF